LNDLATVDPALAEEYSPNNDLKPSQVRRSAKMVAKWICPSCGGEYNYIVADRTVGDDSCPYCNERKVLTGFNDLATVDPTLAKEYSPNNDLKPSQVRRSAKMVAKWVCPTCGGEYSAVVADHSVGDDSCPYCNEKKVLTGFNDLATVDPALAEEYSPNNDLKPSQVRRSAKMVAKWVCPTCGGGYSAVVADRAVGDDSCPYCNNKKVLTGFNDLVTVDPTLAKEYSPNNDLKPSQVRRSAKMVAKWVCPTCGGEYPYPVADRVVGDDSCPYCRNKKILPGYNSLKARHPKLMSQWCDIENTLLGKDPDQMLEKSTDVVWWQCPICHYKYPQTPKFMVMKEKRHMNPCTRCNGRRWHQVHFI